MAYSNAEEVEIFLNGKSLGKKALFSDRWEMPVSKDAIPSGRFVTRYRASGKYPIIQVPWAVAYQKSNKVLPHWNWEGKEGQSIPEANLGIRHPF
jgi:beta-galactosidase